MGKMKKYLIFGLGGITNSGKSTIAAMLCKNLPFVEVMCQDNYFLDPDDAQIERDEDGVRNWEKLSALNMNKMTSDVETWIAKHSSKVSDQISVLVIEGFLIFNHSKLSSLMDYKYFIQINQETCKERRIKRVYVPPDPPGYFENYVWPMYLENLEAITDKDDIEFIDGMLDLNTLFSEILQRINSAIETTASCIGT
ncbi:nicotinamide riboside kinase 1-like [Physella acuta]|uniref:nicotinamide riboside kinase 1-like n=1 Tax=Physella acuta TaxID=109671 RepID=UPI0027DE7D2B|nr:nicotinamide riboside kinase 1-like [Physella acuta]XP_059174089.1 nicotinamide riboside kinase 1-like [Physella acuta]